MNRRLMRAAVTVVALGAVTAGCGGSDGANGASDGSGGGGGSADLRTVDDVQAALTQAGLCDDRQPLTGSGVLPAGSPDTDKLTTSFICDPSGHPIGVSGFASTQDRDVAAKAIGDSPRHYVGTGDNLWIVQVNADDAHQVLAALDGQAESLDG